jgi:tetratricopeptide (TPR) repeat protein
MSNDREGPPARGRLAAAIPRLAAALLCSCIGSRVALAADWSAPKLKLDWKQQKQLELEIRPYTDLVDRYAKGDRPRPVAEIASWSFSKLKEKLQTFMGLAKWVPDWDPDGGRVRAALMLHTDAAMVLRLNLLRSTLQDDAARSLAREFAGHPRLGPFIRRWFLALACDAQSHLYWLDALGWASRGLESFRDDVELRLVVASVEEVLASRTAPPVPDAVFDSPPEADERLPADGAGDRSGHPARALAPRGVSRDHLERALRALEVAAQRQPGRADVELRLGRVEWRLGRFADARRTFEALLATGPENGGPRDGGPREEGYLAHLFYGQLLEDGGALEAAAREYSRAVALDPECQAARLALSHVGLRLGEAAAARSDAELALAAAGHRSSPDAFWQYHWGPSARFGRLLDELRSEAVR